MMCSKDFHSIPFHPINRIKELLPQYYQADKTK
jgi:hypothetical protein